MKMVITFEMIQVSKCSLEQDFPNDTLSGCITVTCQHLIEKLLFLYTNSHLNLPGGQIQDASTSENKVLYV